MKDVVEPGFDPLPHRRGGTPTLHQLRIFNAVARAETLTRAAKDLGLTQPSLSLQLCKLEDVLGTRLFHRRPGEMELTEAGQVLLPQVEAMLRILVAAEDGLAPFRAGFQPVIRLAGIDSALRHLLPVAAARMQARFADVSFDIRESAPEDVVEMLHARRIHVGLVAANSLPPGAGHFMQVPLLQDPYVLAVPESLRLDGVTDPGPGLAPQDRAILYRSVHFVFGSPQANRVDEWYDRLLPGHRPVARCRSFETALGFVRAGVGVCVAPALATEPASGVPDRIRRYRIDVPPRQIVALLLPQQARIEPMASLLAELAAVGAAHPVPGLLPTPPFLQHCLQTVLACAGD